MSNSNTNLVRTALILGATGGFGSALTQCMAQQGWRVRAITRKARMEQTKNVEWIVGDLEQPLSLQTAADNVDVIVHAVNVPYQHWNPLMLSYTRTIIELAQRSNAHLMFVGNVYNAGIPTDGVISEHTPNAPINEKGEIRAQLEDMIAKASSHGLRTTIMRFGDFFGPDINSPNWFQMCTKSVTKNALMMAGPADVPHTWAYLPDAVKAFEQVATIRAMDNNLPNHMVLPFAGHVFSFGQLKAALEAMTGNRFKVTRAPWMMFRALGLVIKLMRDIVSMRYLWNHDIRLDGTALQELLGQPSVHTPLPQAIMASVPGVSCTGQDPKIVENVQA